MPENQNLESLMESLFQDLLEESTRQGIHPLLNWLEGLQAENQALKEQNQRLQDEINRLKGEQGKPEIRPRTRPSPSGDHSSEKERQERKPRHRSTKKDRIIIQRTQDLPINKAQLPADAQWKGYEEVVVQDLVLRTDNVCFRKEKWYSPSTGQTYLAELPEGYQGQFGPGIKSLAITLYFAANVSQPKIRELFEEAGAFLSAGQLSNILIKDPALPIKNLASADLASADLASADLATCSQGTFRQERDAVYEAGLRSSPWQHIDDTPTRVDGQQEHCHVVCNPFYTAYTTTPKKDRLSVMDVLRNQAPRLFVFNAWAYEQLEGFFFSAATRTILQALIQEKEDYSEEEFASLMEEQLPGLGMQQRTRIGDVAAVAAYQSQIDFPIVQLLICDDVPQFKSVTAALALCWVHEGRHYKKMNPHLREYRTLLENFRQRFWSYYQELLVYQEQPTPQERQRLEQTFITLFSTKTDYEALNERIAKTLAKKSSLLRVLEHPEIPLHNNPAELAARTRVRKRDVSLGAQTREGIRAWDTFMTLAATAKKLGVSFYHYIHDRISGTFQLPSLASLIEQRAQLTPLDASWNAA